MTTALRHVSTHDDLLAQLPALRQVETPRYITRLSRWMLLVLVVAMVGLGFVPWQQTAIGKGRVVARDPNDRVQVVEAQIYGRINKWYVSNENTYVKQGDPIVEILDNDPALVKRLESQRAAAESKVRQYEGKVAEYRRKLEAVTRGREPALESARQDIGMGRQYVAAEKQGLIAAEAEYDLAVLQFERFKELLDEGIVSTRDYELSDQKLKETTAKKLSAQAKITAAQADLDSKIAKLEQVDQKTLGDINTATADLNTASAELAQAQAELVDKQVKLTQQVNAQTVYAPRSGRLLRIATVQGGENVKAGDKLFDLVPDSEDLAVELYVDGNDMPLVNEGRTVRLQFEGWPAVQIPGWPSAAVGTFGGTVQLVDATDDGKGKFRILVTPDPQDVKWPGRRWLRQGVRANGWVLLGRVSLGYEVWRQLNGFPPIVAMQEPEEKAPKPPLPK